MTVLRPPAFSVRICAGVKLAMSGSASMLISRNVSATPWRSPICSADP